MGRTADEILSYVSDAAAFLTGNPFLAVAGNSLGAADSAIGGRNKDALGFGLGAAGTEAGSLLGNAFGPALATLSPTGPTAEGLDLASQVTGQTPAFLAQHSSDLLGNTLATLGSAGGALAGQEGAAALEPGLAKTLGLVNSNTSASAPTTMKTVTSSGSGGAGAGGPPGGLSISGSTAPNVQPWVGQNSSSTGGSTQNASQQQTKGI